MSEIIFQIPTIEINVTHNQNLIMISVFTPFLAEEWTQDKANFIFSRKNLNSFKKYTSKHAIRRRQMRRVNIC